MLIAPDGLPALTAAQTARLDWRDDGSGVASPHSTVFDDVYFSRHDGHAETRHVFIDANRLPQRFAAWRESRPFVIGETGFGTGLNMLCAWQSFEQHAPANARLHLVSTECFPMRRADLQRALSVWPELADKAALLVAQWPAPVTGIHRLVLSARVILDLHIGDSCQRLALLDGRVDAWFLDGFAPAKNPQMWQPELFQLLAARSRPGATFATFTCAGIVKRGLKAAGFHWRKVPGFGRKREMLAGEIESPAEDNRRHATPWFVPPEPKPGARVAVIGAGIAGTSIAEALARRGIEVLLFDRQGPGSGASGNPLGALYVKLAADTNLQSRCYLAGLLYSQRWLERLDPGQQLWRQTGVLQLATTERERRRQQRFIAHHPLPREVVRQVDAEQASQLAGLPLPHGGLDYGLAGWVRPRQLCKRLADSHGIRMVRQHVDALTMRAEGGWRLSLDNHQQVSVDQVVIASAMGARNLAQSAGLPLQPVRGQLSRLALNDGMPAPSRVVCAGGYVIPPLNGWLTFGATFAPNSNSTQALDEDHRANLAELDQTLPGYRTRLATVGQSLAIDQLTRHHQLEGRASVRAASPDKSPYAGPVPDASAWQHDYATLSRDATRAPEIPGKHYPGLWISTAHGSRGLASAPLCAELLASRICDEPLPLEAPLADHLHPGRRIIRDLIQAKQAEGKATPEQQ